MKKFVFRLATLVRVKEMTEKQQKMELNMAQNVLFTKNAELNQLFEERTLMKNRFRSDIDNGNMEVYRLNQFSYYLQYMKECVEAKRVEVGQAQKKVDECVAALAVTLNELKVLRKLYDKRYAEYQAQAALEAEKEIGDMLSYKAAVSADYSLKK